MAHSSLGTRYTIRDATPGFVVSGPQAATPRDLAEPAANPETRSSVLSAKTAGYILFVSLFVVEIAISALHADTLFALQPWQWLAFGIAAFRGARALSYNGVFGWLRQPFIDTVPDSSGAGDSVVPRQGARGLRYVIGDCLACPICTGTHVGGVLITLTSLVPSFGLLLTYGLAVAGLAELLHWHSEREEWQGRAAREAAGTEWLHKYRSHVDGGTAARTLAQMPRAERRSSEDRRGTRPEPDLYPVSWDER